MTRFILSAVTLFASIQLHCVGQQTSVFQDISLKQALLKSRSENKLVLLIGLLSWCSHCDNMRNVLNDSSVAKYYGDHYICIAKYLDRSDTENLAIDFNIVSYPTFIFFDGNETVLYRLTGEYSPSDFIEEGKNALLPFKQLPYLEQEFDSDRSDSIKCFQYAEALLRGGQDPKGVINSYLETRK